MNRAKLWFNISCYKSVCRGNRAPGHQPHDKIHLGTGKPRTEMPQQRVFPDIYTYTGT